MAAAVGGVQLVLLGVGDRDRGPRVDVDEVVTVRADLVAGGALLFEQCPAGTAVQAPTELGDQRWGVLGDDQRLAFGDEPDLGRPGVTQPRAPLRRPRRR